MCVCVCVYMYTYICIEREGGREGERKREGGDRENGILVIKKNKILPFETT